MKYLNGTKYLKLNISVDDLGLLKWYIDGSHNLHWDCKRHGGAILTLGKGATTIYLRKVKLNTRSSVETELVVGNMFMPEMLWSLYFIQSQGYEVDRVNLYQDNISTQPLKKNGHFLSQKRTKHINAKFFFIKDRIDGGELKIMDCPTESMWADVLTKPLQRMAFKQNHARLMNCLVEYDEGRGRCI